MCRTIWGILTAFLVEHSCHVWNAPARAAQLPVRATFIALWEITRETGDESCPDAQIVRTATFSPVDNSEKWAILFIVPERSEP